MNGIDLLFIGIILISGLISLFRGFMREIFSLATWILAIWLGIRYAPSFSVHVPEAIRDETLRLGITFTIIFIIVLIIGGLLGLIVSRLIRSTALSSTDRSLGVLFGLLRGVVLIALAVFLVSLTLIPEETWWQESYLVPHFQSVVDWMINILPESLQQQLQELNLDV